MRTSVERAAHYRTRNAVSLHVRSEIHIDRPSHAVWPLLADVRRWPEWSPICTRCCVTTSETLEAGASLKMRLHFRLVAIDVQVRVISLRPFEEIGWETVIRGVRVLHRYSMRPEGQGCVLVNEELFDGVRAPLQYLIGAWFRLTGLSLESLKGIRRIAEEAR
jgi:hypothetical protein